LMFMKKNREGTAIHVHALLCQQFEQVVFFLSMVTLVPKRMHELGEGCQDCSIDYLTRFEFVDEHRHGAYDLLDHVVLVFQLFGWFSPPHHLHTPFVLPLPNQRWVIRVDFSKVSPLAGPPAGCVTRSLGGAGT